MKARYKEIVDEYAAAIRLGELTAGTRLPTHRVLAATRRISLATATRVYAELEKMGLVSGEAGRGTFVREISLPAGLGMDQQVVATDVVDLNFNYPSLPHQAELLRDALRNLTTSGDLESLLRYQPHAGRQNDREAIASWLTGFGLKPAAENILIVNGAQHGLTVAAMGMLRPGDVVAVDALTYSGFKALATLYQLELAPVPVTSTGPDLNALRQLCKRRRIKAIYTMPTLHNPLGWVLDHAQRREITGIAREHDLVIIEDAAYAYLAERSPPPFALLAPERTLYVTGFAKNIAAGLRVGAVVCPPAFRPAIERAIRATVWNTPSLMTTLVAGWLQDGTIRRLESLKRKDARQRQALARERLGSLDYVSHENSYFIWLPLAEEIRAEQVVRQLLNQHISVSTAEPFSTAPNVPHAIRLALGSVSLDKLKVALDKVGDVIQYQRYI